MKPAAILGASLALVFGGSAEASFCHAPTAPSAFSKPTKPVKPRKPYCINEYANTNTCSEWEITAYNDEVRRYNNALRSFDMETEAYVAQLSRYVRDAQAYAKCEVESLDE